MKDQVLKISENKTLTYYYYQTKYCVRIDDVNGNWFILYECESQSNSQQFFDEMRNLYEKCE